MNCLPSLPPLIDFDVCIQVGMETEGFAIYDAMMQCKTEVCFFPLILILHLYVYTSALVVGVFGNKIMRTVSKLL